MSGQYVEINTDQAVKVRIKAINNNSLVLNFKFYNSDGTAYDVLGAAITFTVTDSALRNELLKVENSQWARPASNEISYTIQNLTLPKNEYRVDFTAVFPNGIIQTLVDGDLIVRERYINV